MTSKNGPSPTRKRLDKLLAYHEGAAHAIRTTMSLLEGDERLDARRNGHAILSEAIALDAERTAAVQTTTTAKPKRRAWSKSKAYSHTKNIKARRARTAEQLKYLSKTEPRKPKDPKQIAVMLRHGYIKRIGEGYVRTDKVFTP